MADRFLTYDPPPVRDAVVDSRLRLTNMWRRWYDRLTPTLTAIPSLLNAVQLTSQAAAITSTNFANYSLLAGDYRATYAARISQAAGLTSSLTVTISWTAGGVVQTYSGAAITGNTTATNQSGTVLMRVDKGTAVNYSTAYVSFSGGTDEMEYDLDILLEKVKIS